MNGPRAADDFATIRSRMKELRHHSGNLTTGDRGVRLISLGDRPHSAVRSTLHRRRKDECVERRQGGQACCLVAI